MAQDSLQELYHWTISQLGHSMLLGYELQKVNSQTPGSLFLLLRQQGALRPSAEVQIAYTSTDDLPYKLHFSTLPFYPKAPRPDHLRVSFGNPPEVIKWLKTGRNRF